MDELFGRQMPHSAEAEQAVLGALLIYGTAGASDAGDISFLRTVIQSVIGMLMFVSGAWLGGLMRWMW